MSESWSGDFQPEFGIKTFGLFCRIQEAGGIRERSKRGESGVARIMMNDRLGSRANHTTVHSLIVSKYQHLMPVATPFFRFNLHALRQTTKGTHNTTAACQCHKSTIGPSLGIAGVCVTVHTNVTRQTPGHWHGCRGLRQRTHACDSPSPPPGTLARALAPRASEQLLATAGKRVTGITSRCVFQCIPVQPESHTRAFKIHHDGSRALHAAGVKGSNAGNR